MFWPQELSKEAATLSIIPALLSTQEQFIAVLGVEVHNIQGMFQIIESSKLPANMFLKHLVILADYGGEPLGRVNKRFKHLFPEGKLEFLWDGKSHEYEFKKLPVSNLTNAKLAIDGRSLFEPQPISELYQDVIALLLFGRASKDESVAEVLSKCEIGDYLGKPDQLEKFVRQRYIWVSQITGGAKSNTLGHITQTFVKTYLEDNLNIPDVKFKMDGSLPGVSHTAEDNRRGTTFDVVAHKNKKYVAIEVSFQVTTNSVIERKSTQALSRYEQVDKQGYRIAYVIDGAGNLLQRESAIRTICNYSHCTVALSRSELDVLCQFMRDYFQSA